MMTINSILSTLFASTNHPITMIIYLMSFTMTMSVKTYLIHNNAWYSYTILLIMIGGMMVIFIYMTSTTPNQKIKISTTTLTMLLIILMIKPKQTMPTHQQNLFTNPILEFSSNMTTIMLISYLLLTLITINKITSHFEGPVQTAS